MPGGGTLVNADRTVGGNVHVNNRGDVAFSGVVDTDVDSDGFDDTGLFLWSHGKIKLIARTGTVHSRNWDGQRVGIAATGDSTGTDRDHDVRRDQ